MASQPIVIHVDSDGNPISIPTQTTQPAQPLTTHIDTGGNVIGLNGKLLQGPPSGQGPDIGDVMPSGQQIGTTFANALPPLGATLGTALVPEAAPVSGPLGAAGGAAAANFLRSIAPKYFSENGQAPSALEQATNIGTAAGTEGTAQTLTAAAPEALRLGARAVATLPSFARAIRNQQSMDDFEKELETYRGKLKDQQDTYQTQVQKNYLEHQQALADQQKQYEQSVKDQNDSYQSQVAEREAVKAELGTQAQNSLDKLRSYAKRSDVLGANNDEATRVQEILGKTISSKGTVDIDKLNNLLDEPTTRTKVGKTYQYSTGVSDTTKENLRRIGQATNDANDRLNQLEDIPAPKPIKQPKPISGPEKVPEPAPIPVPEPPKQEPVITQKNGRYFMRYGAGGTAGALAGAAVGAPYTGAMVGAGTQGVIELGYNQISKIAQDPAKTRALVALMNPDTTNGLGKLYSSGLLQGLRGEEVYMTGSDGQRQKVKISDQGVPQLPQNPTSAPSGQSSKYKGQPPEPSPGMSELISQSAGLRQPQAMGRFTKTPIYIDKDNMGINDESTGYYYNKPSAKIILRPTASSSFGENERVLAHEQIHALLDKYGNPVPNTPNTPLIRSLFNESDRAGNPDREIPAYMGAYKEGQVDFVTPQDRQDFVQKYIEGLPKPAQDVFNKIMKSARAANQWE